MKILEKIFSIKNSEGKGHKIVTFFGARLSIRRRKKYITDKQKALCFARQQNDNELIFIDKNKTSKAKILHYSTFNVHCGIAQYLEDFIEGLNENGYTYNAVLPVNYEYLKDSELTFNYINKLIRYAKDFDVISIQHEYGFWEVKNFFNKNKNVDSHLMDGYKTSSFFAYSIYMLDYLVKELILLNKKVVFVWHTDFKYAFDYIDIANYKEMPFFRFFDNDLFTLAVMNKRMKETLEKYSVPTRNVIYMPHPVKTFQSNIQSKEEANDNQVLMGSFGYLADSKKIDENIKALIYLPKNYKYVHVGGVHPRDTSGIYEKYMNLIKELGLQDRVKITGYVDNEKLSSYLSNIDLGLYLAPDSILYGSGSINQLFANKIPVLTSSGSNFSAIAKDWDCLEIIDHPFDSKKIADKILAMINNKDRLNVIKANEERFVKENTFKNFTKNLFQ